MRQVFIITLTGIDFILWNMIMGWCHGFISISKSYSDVKEEYGVKNEKV